MATINGTTQGNVLTGNAENDIISGLAGNDSLSGNGGNDLLYGGTGLDTLNGGIGNDLLDGGTDNDLLQAEAGNDTLIGGAGNDTLNGGAGRDLADYSSATSGVNVNLATGTATGGAGTDRLIGIEDVTGTGVADTLTGGDQANALSGGGGNDLLTGGMGSDTILGGAGDDIIVAGPSSTASANLQANWSQAGLDEANIAGGVSMDAGGVNVTYTYIDDGAGTEASVESNTAVYVGVGEAFDPTSNLYLGGTGAGNTSTSRFDFAAVAGSGYGSSVTNVQFRINDVDASQGNWQDIITIRAWDANGNLVPVNFTFAGNDTASGGTITAGMTADSSAAAAGSVLVTVPGPAVRIEIDYNNTWASGQLIYVSDLHFQTTAPDDDVVDAGDGNDSVLGGIGNDALTGGTGNDTLLGETGNDTLFGGDGNDSLSGGLGDDVITFGAGNDTVDGGDGNDLIDDATGASVAGANLIYGGAGNDTVWSGLDNDTLFGGSGADAMSAEAGSDRMAGDAGDDTLYGGDGDDSLSGGTEADQLYGGGGNDTLEGDAGNDRIEGEAGDDRMVAGLGDDLLSGGDGSDTAVFAGPLGDYSFDYAPGGGLIVIDTVANRDGQDTLTGVESVTFNGVTYRLVTGDDGGNTTLQGPDDGTPSLIIAHDGNDWGGGHATADMVFGGAGNDTLDGGAGDDTLLGEGDNDLLRGDAGNDAIFGGAGADTLRGGSGSDSLDGGAGDDWVTDENDSGTAIVGGADTVTLGDGNDVFTGSGSNTGDNDLIYGGTGNDTITVQQARDTVYGGDGDDVIANRDENPAYGDLLAGDAGNDTITSANGDDSLYGGTGNDVLTGGQGNDRVDGGDGTDRAVFTGAVTEYSFDFGPGGGLIVTDTVANRDGQDTLTGVESVTFNGVTYRLVTGDDGTNTTLQGPDDGTPSLIIAHDGNDWGGGHATADVVFGGAGNDTLDGGAGDDTLLGEGDNDLLRGDAGNDAIFGGAGADTLQGGSGDDALRGGAEGDVLTGGAGNDALDGGDGTDTATFSGPVTDYSFDYGPGGELVVTDTVPERDGSDTLSNVETVTFNGVTYRLVTGDDGGNTTLQGPDDGTPSLIIAHDGNDWGGGHATADVVFGGAGNDTLDGGAGDDTLLGGDGNDLLRGDSGADAVYGGAGADTIAGGAGDVVDGGDGADIDVLDLSAHGFAGTRIDYDSNIPGSGTVTFLDANGADAGTLTFRGIERVVRCFTPGTLIDTVSGARRVEMLHPGDLIRTRDGGMQPLRSVMRRDLTRAELLADPALCPVHIAAGAFGPGLPVRDMAVSPQHRVMVSAPEAEFLFGDAEVLVAAVHLVGHPGVTRAAAADVSYLHLMFDRHEVLCSEGLWTESFQPAAPRMHDHAGVRAELARLFPVAALHDTFGPAARRSLRSHEARVLVACLA